MNLHQQALNRFGNQAQHLKLIEEMAELMQAILKGTNVSEEIADVQIVLDQIKLLHPDWISWEQVKLKRLDELLTPPQRMGDKERESGKRFVDVDGVKMDIAEYLNYKAG